MDFEEDEENGENIRKMASYNRGEAIEEGVVEVRQPALPGDSPPDPQTSALPSSSLSSLQHDRHQSDAFSIASLNSVTSTQDLEKIRVCKECSDEITNTLFDQEALHHFGLL